LNSCRPRKAVGPDRARIGVVFDFRGLSTHGMAGGRVVREPNEGLCGIDMGWVNRALAFWTFATGGHSSDGNGRCLILIRRHVFVFCDEPLVRKERLGRLSDTGGEGLVILT
jgi:hypothetical protein